MLQQDRESQSKFLFGLGILIVVFALALMPLFARGATDEHVVQQDASTPTVDLLATRAQIIATLTAEALLSAVPTTPPTVIPTVTPTPRRPARAIAEVLLGLSVRTGPGLNYDAIGSATVGQQFPIIGKTANCSWLQVMLEDGSVGWITGGAAYVSSSVACAAIPNANVPAAAAPEATAPPATKPTATNAPALPTNTPRPVTAAPVATAVPIAAAPAANIPAGMITSFEPLGNWRRGDEPYGTLSQSTAQVAHGAASAQLAYDFPAAAGGKSYIVFLAQPELRISNDAQSLQLQVYGNGSGHILNAWIRDSGGQIWQNTFGFIKHSGWMPMNATLGASRVWPNQPIGNSSEPLTPPFYLHALVLDGVPDGVASSGVIYLDALTAVGSGAAATAAVAPAAVAPASAAGEAATAVPAVPGADVAAAPVAAPVASGPLSGKIAFSRSNGRTMDTLVYDVASGSVISLLPNVRQPDMAGGLLLVNGDGGGSESILRMTVGGDNTRSLTVNTEDAFPQWSPSMESMVYSSEKGGDRKARLYYQADASYEQGVQPILYNNREIFGDYPVYLDNWRIAVQACNSWAGGSQCGIYTVDTRNAAPTRLTDLTSDIPSGNLGSEVIFSSNRAGNWDVWVVSSGGGAPRQLTTDPAIDGLGVASPDKTSIAFVSNREGKWAVWVMNVDGSNQRKLFDIDGSYGGGDYDWIRERISWGQ